MVTFKSGAGVSSAMDGIVGNTFFVWTRLRWSSCKRNLRICGCSVVVARDALRVMKESILEMIILFLSRTTLARLLKLGLGLLVLEPLSRFLPDGRQV